MQPSRMQRRLKAALKDSARVAANATFRGTKAVIARLDTDNQTLRNVSERVATRVMALGETIIAKSPIPVPGLVRDTLSRMQDALGQLGNTIEGITSMADAQKNAAAATLKKSGFVSLEATEPVAHTKHGHKHSHKQHAHERN